MPPTAAAARVHSAARAAASAFAALSLMAAAAPGLAAQQTPLPRGVAELIERAPHDRAHWGIAVSDAATGETLVGHNADRLFIPASNTKLVVAAAAAHYLDPDFRYTTTLESTGEIVDGVLRGDLVLRGTGDPTISGRYADDMLDIPDALADSLHARGIRRIEGAVVADESHWDGDYVRPDWEGYDLLWWYAAPVSALGFNDNAIDFTIAPGSAGGPATITWRPQTDFFAFVNRTTTTPPGTRSTLDFTRIAGTDTIIAYGNIAADASRHTEYFAVDDPARYAGTVLREALERAGIAVADRTVRVVRGRSPIMGDRRDVEAARHTVLAAHRSVPLPRLIAPVLQTSQNWFAEQLLKTIGRETAGEGSWSSGLDAERRFLIDIVGVDSTAFRLRDASGLSSGNLLTPAALVRILAYMDRTPRMAPARAALPVSGGRTGSLRLRLEDLAGRVAGKTGSINNVDSLSGYLTADSGRMLIFAIVANNSGQSSSSMRPVLDDIVRVLADTY
ncbi:MAG TPA: D-alanyl-D-alanine carboxypeptidase/D-alanyl-D-alanine-endopeptidase [Longimicrobiales bacterium]|nr:D-alanyl-D-alanine carboxypeptidase/D-alanyl-D-alanine-endopeptidase [Longimicrobiales bacterium]